MSEVTAVLPDLDLQPGQLYLSRSPAILRTILGSCVGVTFWSARLGAGALCHCLLPRCPQVCARGSNLADGHRYVDFSIRYLASQFDAIGGSRGEIEVKLFGGADVLPGVTRSSEPTIGTLNCRAALEVLAEEGFTVSASDVGGVRGRRIHFHTGTGEVLLNRLAGWSESQPGTASRGTKHRRIAP